MTNSERQKLRDRNKCFYYKAEGHRAFECLAKTRTSLKVIEEEAPAGGQGKVNP
jgi:hypothetical protein